MKLTFSLRDHPRTRSSQPSRWGHAFWLLACPLCCCSKQSFDRLVGYALADLLACLLALFSRHRLCNLPQLSQCYKAGRKWLVTGTPFSTSLDQLMCQADLIGHKTEGARIDEFMAGVPRAGWVAPQLPHPAWSYGYRRTPQTAPKDRMTNEAIVERLRSVMIRHTKVRLTRSNRPPLCPELLLLLTASGPIPLPKGATHRRRGGARAPRCGHGDVVA